MEPVFMILAQSAATAASLAIAGDSPVQDVPYVDLQAQLLRDEQRLAWPLLEPPAASRESRTTPSASIKPIIDQAGLPRVLLIGDSVSMGYTIPTRELLVGKANVHRVPANAGATKIGLAKLDAWLGDQHWDVIHFNFGLHDAKQLPEGTNHASLQEYQTNLERIVARLTQTGAKLIWATTTPVPNGGYLSPIRRFDSIDAYNAVALEVMTRNGVTINDLNEAITPHLATLGRANDVHFSEAGYEFLAKHVANALENVLQSAP